ncbi:MAG TPA: sulfatase-like hydrolase/transferase [Vicinamibacteria bacterium]|nr:sulfatase-like hydrolase/transferase [Vicinamibacteria bacterium]
MAPPPARPSILLVSIDTLRADHIGCYGAKGVETPSLDALAAQGVLFERALTPVPITLAAHATLFTSWFPHRHGVRDNGLYRLPPDPPTMAALLQGAGYDTAAVVAADVLDRQYGLDRGFRLYDDAVGARGLVIAERPAAAVTDAALRVAASLRGPFLLFVHYYDPHMAYRPPAPWADRFRDRPYDGEIAYVDAELGRLLRALRARVPELAVAVSSDHGEGLGEHGEATHGPFVYQATLRVPLLLAAPGRWPVGRRVADPVSIADVLPTLLHLAGVAPPASLDGRSLVATFSGGEAPPRMFPIESEFGFNSYGWAPLHGVTDGAVKWIGAPEEELYDLTADPAEARNLAQERRAEARRLAASWRETVKEDRRALPIAAASKVADAERMARLSALGYVAGSRAGDARQGRSLPDPKRAIGSLALVNDARRLIGEGAFDAAIRKLEAALASSPRNVSALILLGAAQLRAGRPGLALEPLRRAEATAPFSAEASFNLGLACIGAGDAACAEESFRRALELMPRFHDAAVNLVDLLLQTGQVAPARAAFDAARREKLESPLLDFLEGKLALERGERLAAQDALARALRSGALPAPAAAEARRLLQGARD